MARPGPAREEHLAESKDPKTGEVLIMAEKINIGKPSYQEYIKEARSRGENLTIYNPRAMAFYKRTGVKDE